MNLITDKRYTLIIGAGDRLGTSLSVEFARQKKHLILASQNGDNLLDMSNFLENKFDVAVHIYETDFTEKEVPYVFKEWLSPRFPIEGMVVNAAGNLAGKSETRRSLGILADILASDLEKHPDFYYFTIESENNPANRLIQPERSFGNYLYLNINKGDERSRIKETSVSDPEIASRLAVTAAIKNLSLMNSEGHHAEKLNDLY